MRVILTVLALSSLSQLSWGCCTPKQWQGDMEFMIGSNWNGKGGYQSGVTKIFYDAKNTKIAFFTEGVVDGRPYKVGVIQDFEAGVQYTLFDGRCNTTKLGPVKFKEMCVPVNSKAVNNTHLGTADDSLDVTVYRIPNVKAYFTVTNKLCIPVGETIIVATPTGGSMTSLTFTGIEPGIADPRVFDKPKDCSARLQEGKVELFEKFGFQSYKMSSLF